MTIIKEVSVIRLATISVLTACLSFTGAAVPANAEGAAQHGRKLPKPRKPAAPVATSAPHSINAPSTDFSKIERSDGDSSGPDGPSLRPAMGAGGMGLGGSF